MLESEDKSVRSAYGEKKDEEDEKLTRKEKLALAFIIIGSVIMFSGLALLAYILLTVLGGVTYASVIYYFAGGLVVAGYLIREIGFAMKT